MDTNSIGIAKQEKDGQLCFNAVLRPNASLSQPAFRIFAIFLALLLLGIGGFFFSIGAWPVFGFMGIEFALIYYLFRRNYRAAKRYEHVRLTKEELQVDKVSETGDRRSFSLSRPWLQVFMDDPPKHDSKLTLRSHNKKLIIGRFLTPEERLDFARALQKALHPFH